MKIGDKVYCIKDRPIHRLSTYKNVNKSGKTYEIIPNKLLYTKDDKNIITTSNDINDNTYHYSIVDNGHHYYFYDYFMTQKEFRKLKLEKLNEIKTSNIL